MKVGSQRRENRKENGLRALLLILTIISGSISFYNLSVAVDLCSVLSGLRLAVLNGT
jgi:hypothetical protein